VLPAAYVPGAVSPLFLEFCVSGKGKEKFFSAAVNIESGFSLVVSLLKYHKEADVIFVFLVFSRNAEIHKSIRFDYI
jgi:hypothetical protein